MAFMSIDKLQTAEDLIRRTIAIEQYIKQQLQQQQQQQQQQQANGTTFTTNSSGAGSHNRKLLADILAGQNLAAKAINEYQLILQDDESTNLEKLAAAQKCAELLVSLGRTEELPAINQIINRLTEATDQ
jgi:hypothetical protein